MIIRMPCYNALITSVLGLTISKGRKVNPCALVSLSTHGWCEEHRRSMP